MAQNYPSGYASLLSKNRTPAAAAPVDRRASSPSAAKGMVQVVGRIDRVRFFNEQTGQGSVTVIAPDGKRVSLIGLFAFAPAPGKHVDCSGVDEVHPRWGPQVKCSLVMEGVPTSAEDLGAYLQRVVRGLDRDTAMRMVARFGPRLPEVIEQRPRDLLTVPGLDVDRMDVIVRSWERETSVRRLWAYLADGGVSGEASARIFKKYGSKALEVAQRKPYDLASVPGVGFEAVEGLATRYGQAGPSASRTAAAALSIFNKAESEGDTCLPEDELAERVARVLRTEPGVDNGVHQVLRVLESRGAVKIIEQDGRRMVGRQQFASDEEAIAWHVARLVNGGPKPDEAAIKLAEMELERAVKGSGMSRDADQAAAITNVFQYPVTVLTGGPGCGKTTVSRIVGAVAEQRAFEIRQAAPTNKAARRVTEASGRPANTLHFLLECAAADDGIGFKFKRGSSNPLDGDLFTIDEMTLADVRITRAYLEAIPTGARLLFSGDVDQLQSVGAGAVLADLIESGVLPVSRLNTPHRSALDSDIVKVAHQINRGLVEKIDLNGTGDVRFFMAEGEAAVMQAARRRYAELVERFGPTNVQVLACQYETGVGINALNQELREIANPPAAGKKELQTRKQVFREGDRVIRESTLWYKRDGEDDYVANGEVGTLLRIDPDRKGAMVKFGQDLVHHDLNALASLAPAFATSVHRAQGGEAPGVLFVAPREHHRMLNRNSLFTGLTRGKKQSDFVTDPKTFKAGVRNVARRRNTLLKAMLRQALPQLAAAKNVQLEAPRPPAAPSRQLETRGSGIDQRRLAPSGFHGYGGIGRAAMPPPATSMEPPRSRAPAPPASLSDVHPLPSNVHPIRSAPRLAEGEDPRLFPQAPAQQAGPVFGGGSAPHAGAPAAADDEKPWLRRVGRPPAAAPLPTGHTSTGRVTPTGGMHSTSPAPDPIPLRRMRP